MRRYSTFEIERRYSTEVRKERSEGALRKKYRRGAKVLYVSGRYRRGAVRRSKNDRSDFTGAKVLVVSDIGEAERICEVQRIFN